MSEVARRRLTAWHEAAHAAVAAALYLPLGLVSIRQGASHDGVAFVGGQYPPRDLPRKSGPLMFESVHRLYIEHQILVSLAGHAGEMLSLSTGYGGAWDEADDARALELARRLTAAEPVPPRLDPLDRKLLAASEANPHHVSDEETALRIAELTTDDDLEAHRLVAYLRAVVARMVWREPVAGRVAAIATDLLASPDGVLDPERVGELTSARDEPASELVAVADRNEEEP
jgi:hypothetical protein